jgi:hypothetical protein
LDEWTSLQSYLTLKAQNQASNSKKGEKMEALWYIDFWPVLAVAAVFVASVVWYLRRRGNPWIGFLTVCLMFLSFSLIGFRLDNVRSTIDGDIMVDNISCALSGSSPFDYKGLDYWSRVGHAFVFLHFNEHGVPQRKKGISVLVCPDGTNITSTQY